ncbi:MAG: AsmA family protein [Pseudomonadales bacterium]
MKRFVIWLLSALLGVLVLTAGGLWLATVLIDEEVIKTQLSQQVRQQTGGELEITGNIDWVFFPDFGFSLGNSRFTPAKQTQALAEIDQLELGIELAPLLGGQINIQHVALDGIRLYLHTDANADNNWDFATQASDTAPQTDNASSNELSMAINHISISQGQIHYIDERNDTDLQLNDISLDTRQLNFSGRPFQISAGASLSDKDQQITAQVDATASIDLAAEQFTLSKAIINAQGQRGSEDFEFTAKGDISGQLAEGIYQFTAMQLNSGPLAVNTDLTLLLAGEDIELSGNIDIPSTDLQHAATLLDIDLPELAEDISKFSLTAAIDYRADQLSISGLKSRLSSQDNSMDITASGNITGQLDSGRWQTSALTIAAGPIQASGQMTLIQNLDNIQANGQLTLPPFNAQQALLYFGMEPIITSDKDALSRVSLNTKISFDNGDLRLTELQGRLDDSLLAGQVLRQENGSLRLKLDIDQIDANRYLAPTGTTSDDSKNDDAADEPLPLDTLHELSGSFNLAIGQLKFQAFDLDTVLLDAVATQGNIDIRRLSTKLYGGNLAATGQLNSRSEQLTISLKGREIDLTSLLTSMADVNWVAGRAQLDIDITSKGASVNDWQHNANGTGNITINQVVLSELNIERQLCEGIAQINREALSDTSQWPPDTAIDSINGQLRFVDGVIHNDKLTAELSNMTVGGKGQVNPMKNSVDYLLSAQLVGDMRNNDPACRINDRLKSIHWPMRCKGSLDDEPSELCGIDSNGMSSIIEQMATYEIQRQADKLIENALDKWLKK